MNFEDWHIAQIKRIQEISNLESELTRLKQKNYFIGVQIRTNEKFLQNRRSRAYVPPFLPSYIDYTIPKTEAIDLKTLDEQLKILKDNFEKAKQQYQQSTLSITLTKMKLEACKFTVPEPQQESPCDDINISDLISQKAMAIAEKRKLQRELEGIIKEVTALRDLDRKLTKLLQHHTDFKNKLDEEGKWYDGLDFVNEPSFGLAHEDFTII